MKTAMILAAGRGERCRPFTDKTPKALYPIDGRPVIEHHVLSCAAAGIERIVINHAYLGDQIRHHLGNGQRFGLTIHYSPEPPGGLETAGGIINALPLLGNDPFLSINADIFSTISLETIKLPADCLATLVLVPTPAYKKQGDFDIDAEGYLTNDKKYTYSGIACYHPEAFHAQSFGRYSVTQSILRSLAEQRRIKGQLHEGDWMDVGV